ncbi:MAG TPA: hypothetical protein EYO31_05655 [Phycisphaerales bacterium]|nr:hypothetical protein [Phycisphaerales bacterium]
MTEFEVDGQGSLNSIAVDNNDGSMYVAHNMDHYVKKFDAAGNFVAQQYAYANPADVAVDESGNVYLTATKGNGAGTHQVRIYSDFENGVLAAKIGNGQSDCSIYFGCLTGGSNWTSNTLEEGDFRQPESVAVKNGKLYVGDGNGIHVFNVKKLLLLSLEFVTLTFLGLQQTQWFIKM